jgi:hypothetical protein
MAHEAFLDRSRTRARTSLGDVELPVLYRDASAVFCYFRVDPSRAAEGLEGTPLAPARFAGGTALAALAAYDYRDTSIVPYREVGLGVAVVPRTARAPALPLLHLLREPTHRDVSWHVLHLPVTTQVADVGGRELYGFPKLVTELDVWMGGDAVRVAVAAPVREAPILILEGHAGPGVPLPAIDLVQYTIRDGELLRTVVEAQGGMHTGLGRGLVLRAGHADPPMAARVAALGLDGARPLAGQVCRAYRAVLNAPAPFLPVAGAA